MNQTPPRRLAFRVEYDGTDFHGWARQPNQRTVQGTLEATLSAFLGEPVRVDGASRTDAGVHARDQLAAITLRHPIRPGGLQKGANRRLPPDVSIGLPEPVALDFEPRFGNSGKTYCYRFRQGRSRRPLLDRTAWRLPWTVDVHRVLAAGEYLLGTKDFASFSAADARIRYQSTVRTLWALRLSREAHGVWALRISGTAFMKYMVRNMVGTMMDIGRGRWAPEKMLSILAARDRSAAGFTAPPQGLELERIWRDGPLPPNTPDPRLAVVDELDGA